MLIVGVNAAEGTDLIGGVTYGGVAMTQVAKLIDYNSSGRSIYLYCLPGPALGANDVVVTYSGVNAVRATSASYTGVVQSASLDNIGTNSGTGVSSIAHAITPVADNCWVVGYLRNNLTGTVTDDAGTTARNTSEALNGQLADTDGPIHPPASTSLGFSWSGAATAAALVASLAPTPSSPSASVSPSRSASASASPSVSPSSSLSPSASRSPSSSASASTSPSASLSPSASASASLSPSASRSPSTSTSPSGSVSPSASISPSSSRSPSVSASVSVSPSPGSVANPYVSFNGVPYATDRLDPQKKVLHDTLSVTDVVDDTPSRASCSVWGATPTIGDEFVAALGSDRIFAGPVLTAEHVYVGTPANYARNLSAIDYTWLLDLKLVTRRYVNTTGTAIIQDLIATYAPAFTVIHVAADLDVIDEITFTNQQVSACLTQVLKRLGGYWYCDYYKDIHAFLTETGDDPVALTPAHPSLMEFAVTIDLSQVITRALVEGGGGSALVACAAGETILPVDDASWYDAGGGRVTSGPQRIAYAGVSMGGGGSLVGPGATPSSAPAASLAGGSGIDSGAHDYAVTFVTGAGESLVGPRVSITVGTVAAPTQAPTLGVPTVGAGPDPGAHDYAVTFVTASGETTASQVATVTTGVTAAPGTYPAASATNGGSVDPGPHQYGVTFVTTAGETPSGPVVSISLGGIDPPATYPSGALQAGGNLGHGSYYYAITFVTALGETTAGPWVRYDTDSRRTLQLSAIPSGPTGTTARRIYRSAVNKPPDVQALKFLATIADNTTSTYTDSAADSTLGSDAPASNTTVANAAALAAIPLGGANVTARKVYRTVAGGTTLKYVATIADNSTTTYNDTLADTGLGADAPSTNTALVAQVAVSAIPVGGAAVTKRRLYRTVASGSQLKLVAELADNSTTTYADTLADAGLGTNVPTSNTATANQVALTGIPIGGATVTARKVYRTVAAGSQLKLVATIADNTTAAYTDSTADASLGANAPSSDTSGLAQENGQVSAGSTALIVAGTGAFAVAGGWAVIGNGQQVIRYAGVTGTQLTGVPASGPGAIVASIGYNSTVTAAPQLTGIPASGPGSIQWQILRGDAVNLLVQVDDPVAQATLAGILAATLGSASDGIREGSIQDGRISQTEAEARGAAFVALRGTAEVSIRYKCRDPLTRAGRTIHVDLPAPTSVTGDFKIQQVTITDFHPSATFYPTYDVQASTTRYALEDLLRMARATAASR